MPRNGSGAYIPPASNPVAPGSVIESTWANDTISDIAIALSQSISTTGESTPTANLPMGGRHHTNVSDPTSRNQYVSLGMAQDGRHCRVTITGGTNDLVGTLVGGLSSLVQGMIITLVVPETNTGAMTLSINGLAAKSIVSGGYESLQSGNVGAGDTLVAVYDGEQFVLLTDVSGGGGGDVADYLPLVSGQNIDYSSSYPYIVKVDDSTVRVPSGSGVIIYGSTTSSFSWDMTDVTILGMSDAFCTTLYVGESGEIQQSPGFLPPYYHRAYIVLGVVEHVNGEVTGISNSPAVLGADSGALRDLMGMLAGTISSGGKVSVNVSSKLRLNVEAGSIFYFGGSASSQNNPNRREIPPKTGVAFYTLAGEDVLDTPVYDVPVGYYDADGLGTVDPLPGANDATIHRLFFLFGKFILAYGQKVYSSVENALSMIDHDRTAFVRSSRLDGATLLAEIVARRSATDLTNIAHGAIVCPVKQGFSLGGGGGGGGGGDVEEAPEDGSLYGRMDAGWVAALPEEDPNAIYSLTVIGDSPTLTVDHSETGDPEGVIKIVSARTNKPLFTIETDTSDDKTRLRSYSYPSMSLRHTTTYDLDTGEWEFPSHITGGEIKSRVSPTNDAVVMAGRVGGIDSNSVTITPAELSGSHTLTLPDASGVAALDHLIPNYGFGGGWTTRVNATNNDWNGVCYGNGLFVAVASSGVGNRVMTSPDGVRWTSRASAADNTWNRVCYGNGLFVAVASSGTGNRVMTSTDGVTWTSRTSAADNAWMSVCYGNGLFVAVASSGTGNRVMTSPDGITWTARASAADNAWASVCYGNGLFVAVTMDGVMNSVMTSPDGVVWTSRTLATENGWASVCYGSGLFVAVASNGTDSRVITSPDGVAWTLRVTPADYLWASVCYGNGLFVAVASDGDGDGIMTSPDGVNWELEVCPADNSWCSVCYGNGVLVAVSYDGTSDRVMTSGKGEVLTPYSDNRLNGDRVFTGNLVMEEATEGGVFTGTISPSKLTSNQSYELPDESGTLATLVPLTLGRRWTSGVGNGNQWNSVCYGLGLFVTVASTGSGNRVANSPDGVTWTIRASAADYVWNSVCYGNGLFVAVASSGTGDRVMTSPDGANWTLRTSAADNNWNSVCYGDGLFVAVASSGTGNRVMTSPDGITWTSRTSAADNDWSGVCYGEGLFVAVASSGTGNRVMTSPDGITWTARASAADNSWTSVCTGGGIFIAVASSGTGNRVMSSADGLRWTVRGSAADHSWTSVSYGRGLFVAVSETSSNNRIMVGSDAVVWSLWPTPQNSWAYTEVTYGGGRFVGVSVSGFIVSS